MNDGDEVREARERGKHDPDRETVTDETQYRRRIEIDPDRFARLLDYEHADRVKRNRKTFGDAIDDLDRGRKSDGLHTAAVIAATLLVSAIAIAFAFFFDDEGDAK